MKYYSTNKKAPEATLEKAVVKGLAEDRGLYMPEIIKALPESFFANIERMSFQEIAYTVADAFFGEDVDAESLKQIVYDTLQFDCPVVKVDENIYTLELFHGPTLAFKDVGARFMARLLQYFLKQGGEYVSSKQNSNSKSEVNVLVATSGDTGSAVANGFLGVDGIHVYVLYPKGNLIKIAKADGLETFYVPDGVGGRFSELCPVGLIAAAVCGIDIEELLAGAAYMDELCSEPDYRNNMAYMAAICETEAMKKGCNISVMMPYADSLKYIADWYAQLWAESLGKRTDNGGSVVHTGQTPVKALGVTDQHSHF